ncbi:MAG: hypothetical protein IJI67_08150 [Clostridia bacterium]|nr:hypothetical protein [Clostridia bacterium]
MFMSALWDTIFELSDNYENARIFLMDNHIPALQFGNADKPVVFAAGFGAAEWQSSVLLLKFFEQLLYDAAYGKSMAGIAIRKAFKKRSVVIVPCVCPPKMVCEDEPLQIGDLSGFAKYLSFHQASMLLCVSGSEGNIFAPQSNALLPADTETVGKIICACSKLPAAQTSDLIAAKFCHWVSLRAQTPAFVISPRESAASALERSYRSLEETFAVSALL